MGSFIQFDSERDEDRIILVSADSEDGRASLGAKGPSAHYPGREVTEGDWSR